MTMDASLLHRFASLAGKKYAAHLLIDQEAGRTRAKYITDTTGQEAVYLVKLAQAQAFVADPESTPGPYIAMEAAATGSTPIDVANLILANAAQWNDVLGPPIEAARLGGKKAVSDAESVEAVEQALATALAALQAL